MIRRDVLTERDQGVVRTALVAAAFALSLGFYAQHALASHTDESNTVTIEKAEVVLTVVNG